MSEKVDQIMEIVKGLSTLELAELEKALSDGAIMNSTDKSVEK